MSRHQFLLLGVALAAVVSAWGPLSADAPDPSSDEAKIIEQLQAQIAALDQRVKALEEQQTFIQPVVGEILMAPGQSSRPLSDPPADPVPPTWGQGEINGLRFYTIPLGLPKKAQ